MSSDVEIYLVQGRMYLLVKETPATKEVSALYTLQDLRTSEVVQLSDRAMMKRVMLSEESQEPYAPPFIPDLNSQM